MTLVEKLIEIQADNELSDEAFGDILGISRIAWFNIRKGDKGLGMKALAGVIREYPHLKPVVLDYILQTDDKKQTALVA